MPKDLLYSKILSNELSPEQALDASQKHSTRLSEIALNLNSKPLICGFPTLERHQYLMEGEGNLVVMAARPGNGKTALACQIGLNVAKKSRVLYFSLEMKKEALRKRLLSVISQVPIKKLGFPQYKAKVDEAIELQKGYNFDVIDDPDLTINDIISKVYDEYSRDKIALVIIDYIGIIKVNNDFRATSIGDVAKRIKRDLADKFRIPVIVLAQMNRGFDSRKSAAESKEEIRPTLADIGESSGIEHASDVVMFLHRPYLVDANQAASDFRVYVCKNRNGDVKDFSLEFSCELTKFFDMGEL